MNYIKSIFGEKYYTYEYIYRTKKLKTNSLEYLFKKLDYNDILNMKHDGNKIILNCWYWKSSNWMSGSIWVWINNYTIRMDKDYIIKKVEWADWLNIWDKLYILQKDKIIMDKRRDYRNNLNDILDWDIYERVKYKLYPKKDTRKQEKC